MYCSLKRDQLNTKNVYNRTSFEIGSLQFAASRLLNFQLYCNLKRDGLNTTFYITEKVRPDNQHDELQHLPTCNTV